MPRGGVDPALYTLASLQAVTREMVTQHSAQILAGEGADVRWHLGGGSATQLADEQIAEWLHGFGIAQGDVLYQGFEGGKKFRPSHPRVWALSSFFHKLLQDGGLQNVRTWGRSINLSKLETVIFPIHHPGPDERDPEYGGHWTVVAADLRTATITSFDSFRHRGQPTDIPYSMKPILLRLQAWLVTILPRTPFAAHNGRWQWRQQTCTVQFNAVDCGIHALLNIVKVLTPTWPVLHDEDPALLRVWMFNAICSRRQYLETDRCVPLVQRPQPTEGIAATATAPDCGCVGACTCGCNPARQQQRQQQQQQPSASTPGCKAAEEWDVDDELAAAETWATAEEDECYPDAGEAGRAEGAAQPRGTLPCFITPITAAQRAVQRERALNAHRKTQPANAAGTPDDNIKGTKGVSIRRQRLARSKRRNRTTTFLDAGEAGSDDEAVRAEAAAQLQQRGAEVARELCATQTVLPPQAVGLVQEDAALQVGLAPTLPDPAGAMWAEGVVLTREAVDRMAHGIVGEILEQDVTGQAMPKYLTRPHMSNGGGPLTRIQLERMIRANLGVAQWAPSTRQQERRLRLRVGGTCVKPARSSVPRSPLLPRRKDTVHDWCDRVEVCEVGDSEAGNQSDAGHGEEEPDPVLRNPAAKIWRRMPFQQPLREKHVQQLETGRLDSDQRAALD